MPAPADELPGAAGADSTQSSLTLRKPRLRNASAISFELGIDSPCFTQELDGRDAVLEQLLVEVGQLQRPFGVGRAQAVPLNFEPIAEDSERFLGLLQLSRDRPRPAP